MTPTSIKLSWEVPSKENQNGDIIGYHVNVTEVHTNTSFQLTTTNTVIHINSLHSFYSYKIQVVAYNVIGNGPYSTAIYETTSEAGKI